MSDKIEYIPPDPKLAYATLEILRAQLEILKAMVDPVIFMPEAKK